MKSRIFLCLLALCSLHGGLIGQTKVEDSLKALLSQSLPDSTLSRIYCKLADRYMVSQPDTALFYSQQGLKLARNAGFIEGEIIGLDQTASIFNIIGNYPRALHYFLEALQKAEASNNRRRNAISMLNIGSVYYYQGDYPTAIRYSLEAKEILDFLKDDAMIMTGSLNLSEYYEKWNKLDSAIYFTQQAASLAVSMHDNDFLGMSYNNLGNIYSKVGQSQIALDFYRSGLKNLVAVGNDDAVCECALGMAHIFAERVRKDSALYYGKLSMTTALDGGFTNRVHKAAGFLAKYYESLGYIDSAFAYLKVFNLASDSLFSQARVREIQNLTFTETLRQQENAQEISTAQSERKSNIQFGILGMGILTFTILFLLISRTIIVNERWISFLGIMALLLVFEFVNLLLHPYIADLTHHSPFYMLLISVTIAAVLIPVHHRGEHLIKYKMVEKNKRIRLAAAERTIRELKHDEGFEEGYEERDTSAAI